MVSCIENRITRDGRKRAPLLLFGTGYRKPFPWIRVGLSISVMLALAYNRYRRLNYVAHKDRFIQKIDVVPYGVMGNQMSLQGSLRREASEPDESTAILDPADLMVLYTNASKATGMSSTIYRWLGLKGAFPDDVVMSMGKVCDAKHHSYGADGSKNVIHVATPDFREGTWSEREAALELSRAYRNALHEFVISNCDSLRLVPLSSGAQAGPLYNEMPRITYDALLLAFEQLHMFDTEYLLRENKRLELCVFVNREWDTYRDVFKSNLDKYFKM